MAEKAEIQALLAPLTVYERTSLSRSTVWRMVRAGAFPAPVKISENRIAWNSLAIDNWIESRQSTLSTDQDTRAGVI